jgi:type II secretory pathway component PulF
MPFFEYRAVDGKGAPTSGSRRGESADDVRRELLAEGLRASSIVRRDDPGTGGFLRPGVTVEDLAFLHRQTAHLLAAGLPLPLALRTVARESGKHEFHLFVDAIASDVEKGRSLSDALRDHARVVPPFLPELIKAGEAAGNLPAVLLHMAEGGEAESRLQRSIRSSLAYPMTVAAFALAIVIANGTGLVTSLFFNSLTLDSDPVQFLGGLGRSHAGSILLNFISSPVLWGILLTAFLLAGLWGISFFSLRGCRTGIPVFGRVVRQVLISRFCRVLGLLAERGIPLPAALRLAGMASDSATLAKQADHAATQLESGQPLAVTVEALDALLATACWGLSAAASRGDLPAELQAMARHADERMVDQARVFSIVLEMTLIVVMGAFVLFGAGGSMLRLLSHMTNMLSSLTSSG